MTVTEQNKKHVAVIGSGMAGLVSAYLIQQDKQHRYSVEIFEAQSKISLDSASYSIVPADDKIASAQRIDLPMRALDGNFHINLKRMYDYLGIQYTSSKFIYPLSHYTVEGRNATPYFIHSSSNHRVPPIRPEGLGRARWILETIFLTACYFWFTVCCFLVAPKVELDPNDNESLREYLRRIRLPNYFARKYLLPLMSSVTTCPHEALLNFPATDAIDYARRTFRQPHFTVVGGVQNVQSKLCAGQVVRLGAVVTEVKHVHTGVRLSWIDSKSKLSHSADFDHVIMAVTPNVTATLYEPLKATMRHIPVILGESIVHCDISNIPQCARSLQEAPAGGSEAPQIMHIRSNDSSTESIHIHPDSVFVTNFPISPIDPSTIMHRAQFTRVLRTTKSRAIINRIFALNSADGQQGAENGWHNGDDNIWLVGAWCWDGMVLLEGCVVSAMRVATGLGIDIPWFGDT